MKSKTAKWSKSLHINYARGEKAPVGVITRQSKAFYFQLMYAIMSLRAVMVMTVPVQASTNLCTAQDPPGL